MMPLREPGGVESSTPFSVVHTRYRGGSTPVTRVLPTRGTGHFAWRLRTCSSGVRSSLSG